MRQLSNASKGKIAGLVLALLIALAIVGAAAAWGKASGRNGAAPRASIKIWKLAPAVACTSANRMDIFVDEDGMLWECTCEALMTTYSCHWQVIGGTDPVKERRIRLKIATGLLPPRFFYSARGRYLVRLR